MLKTCVMIDILPNSGGGIHMAKSICKIIKDQKTNEVEFKFLTTYTQTKKILEQELKIQIDFFDKSNLKNRIFSKLYRSKYLDFFIKLSPLEKYLKQNSFDLIYFISPSFLVLECKKLNCVYTIWETQFDDLPNFPEYQDNTIRLRNESFNHAAKYSKKIFVSTKKLSEEIKKKYNISNNKIILQTFPPSVTTKKIEENYIPENLEIKNIINEKFFYYPAQYWKHKNHEYIINAVKLIKKTKIDFKIIFSGHDKGYLHNLKSLTKKLNIEDLFIFFDYVSDEDLIILYKNCHALIIPSLVGTHTFPLYEGFYFQKPLIYNYQNLDDKFLNCVIKLDINNLESLENCFDKLQDKMNINKMVNENFILYEKNFSNTKFLTDQLLKFKN